MTKRLESAKDADDTHPSLSRDTLEVEVSEEPRAKRVDVLHVIDGAQAGLIFVFETAQVVVGRDETCELSLADPGVSRSHATFSRSAIGVQVVDQGSRNGTYLNGRRLMQQTLLRQGDTIAIGGVRLRYGLEAEEQVKRLRDLHDAAVRDHLTRLYNRRFFDEGLTAEVAYAIRHRSPLSLLIFDIDRFKQINDTHGHMVGDLALKAVARVLEQGVRTEDLVARYGGDEITVLARGAGIEGALVLAERLRERVQAASLSHDRHAIDLRVSAGAASLGGRITNARQLVRAADGALLDAKQHGRNRVLAASAEGPIERTGEMEAVVVPISGGDDGSAT